MQTNEKPNANKPPNDPISDYDYYAEDILKVWDQNIKEQKLQYYYAESKPDFLTSLFKDEKAMSPLYSAGIIVNPDHSLHLFEDKKENPVSQYSVSLCHFVEPHEELTHLERVYQQVESWNKHKEPKVKRHAVLFPYHQGPKHWNLVVLWLTFTKPTNLTKALLEIYEPLYTHESQKISKLLLKKLETCLSIGQVEWRIIPTKQQKDSTSCGAISAENGIYFIDKSEINRDLLKTIYPPYALTLRKKHIDDIGICFAEKQRREKEIEEKKPTTTSSSDTSETPREFIAREFITWFTQLSEEQQKQAKETFFPLLQKEMMGDEYPRIAYSNARVFLEKNHEALTSIKVSTENLITFFLTQKGWRDGAIDTLHLIARNLKLLINQNPPATKTEPVEPYDKRPSLTKSFPGPLYQCLVALHHMLELIKNDTDFKLRMEDAHSGAFDDIIIEMNGKVEYIQIKHKYDQKDDVKAKSKKEDTKDQYDEGDFTAQTGAVELHKYFDDWYLFIENADSKATTDTTTEVKNFTFHSSGSLNSRIKDYFINVENEGCDKINFSILKSIADFKIIAAKNKPSTKLVKSKIIYLYEVEKKWRFSLRYSDSKGDLVHGDISTEAAPMKALASKNFAKLTPLEEEQLRICISNNIFIDKLVKKIKNYSVICNPKLYTQRVKSNTNDDSDDDSDERDVESTAEKKKKLVSQAAVLELRKRQDKWKSLSDIEIKNAVNKFLENFRFKFNQDNINQLEQTVKKQVFDFIEEAISSENVYHALILEVHHWLRSMKAIPWDRNFVINKLNTFKKRYIDLVHKIGESQLCFRQINSLPLYNFYAIFSADFNGNLNKKIEGFLKEKSQLLLLTAKDTNEGSILIEQYLQSKFNKLVFGQYIYFDGRYLQTKSLQVAAGQKEMEVIIVDHADMIIAQDYGIFLDAIANVLKENKKIIIICRENNAKDLNARFKDESTVDSIEMPSLSKDQAMLIAKRFGSNKQVVIGDKFIDIDKIDWQQSSLITETLSHLPTLIQALTYHRQVQNKQSLQPIPLVLKEQVSLYNLSTLLDLRQSFAVYLETDEDKKQLLAKLSTTPFLEIEAADLQDKPLEDIVNPSKDSENGSKKNNKPIVINCRQVNLPDHILASKLADHRYIVLTNEQKKSNMPVVKIATEINPPKDKKAEKNENLLFEFCQWHAIQDRIKKDTTKSKEAGEDYNQLITLANDHGHVVICAEAGSGKSTIARAIYDAWCQDTSSVPAHWLVFIELRRLKLDDANKELIDLVQTYYINEMLPSWQLTLLKRALAKEQVIFILDGWDEVQPSQKEKLNKLITKLIQYSKIIWTTRPSEVLSLPFTIRKQFDLKRFDPDKIKLFFQQRFSKENSFADQAFSFIAHQENQPTFEMIGLPLQCHLLCEIWQPHYQLYLKDKATPLPWHDHTYFNKINLYQEFIRAKLWRYLMTVSKADEQTLAALELRKRIYLFCSAHLQRLQEIAFETLAKNNHSHDYQELLDNDLQKIAITVSPQLLEGVPIDSKDKITIHFLHKTYAEYLIAVYFAKQLASGNIQHLIKNNFLQDRYQQDYLLRWEFLTAIISWGDPAIPNVKNSFAAFWQLLLAEPRDLIGIAEKDLLIACIKNTNFSDSIVKKSGELHDLLQNLKAEQLKQQAILNRAKLDEKDNAGTALSSPSNANKAKPIIAEFKPISLPHYYKDRGIVLSELGEKSYTPKARLEFLKWLKDTNSKNSGVQIVQRRIANIVIKLLENSHSNESIFLNDSSLLDDVFAIIGTWEGEGVFDFIKKIQPTTEQVNQMLKLVGEKNISNAMLKTILHCLYENINKDFDLQPLKNSLNHTKDNEHLKKITYLLILQRHQPDNKNIYNIVELSYQLLKQNINIISTILFIFQKLNITKEFLSNNMITMIYKKCAQLITDKDKKYTKECLLFLDHCHAVDDELLKPLFSKVKDSDYWDVDVVFPSIENFANTKSFTIYQYIKSKHKKEYKWSIRLDTFIDQAFYFFKKIKEKEYKINILNDLISAYDNTSDKYAYYKFYSHFNNTDPLELLPFILEIYNEASPTKDNASKAKLANFIFDYCLRFKIALVIEQNYIVAYYNKGRIELPCVNTAKLKEEILGVRKIKNPEDKLQLLPSSLLAASSPNSSYNIASLLAASKSPILSTSSPKSTSNVALPKVGTGSTSETTPKPS